MITVTNLAQTAMAAFPVSNPPPTSPQAVMSQVLMCSLTDLLKLRLGGTDNAEIALSEVEQTGRCVIVEPGDNLAAIEQAIGCPIQSDWFGDSQYGEADFAPAFDWLTAHVLCYELGYILNDDGMTLLLIVPKLTGIDTELLRLCQTCSEQETTD